MPAWLSFGKLRASYAQSSNGTLPYQNNLTYGLQGYTVSSQPIGNVSTGGLIPNANLKPVKIAEKGNWPQPSIPEQSPGYRCRGL